MRKSGHFCQISTSLAGKTPELTEGKSEFSVIARRGSLKFFGEAGPAEPRRSKVWLTDLYERRGLTLLRQGMEAMCLPLARSLPFLAMTYVALPIPSRHSTVAHYLRLAADAVTLGGFFFS